MAGQTDRPTKPITSSDTIALITNTLMPAIEEIKGDIKVINTKLENIGCDAKDLSDAVKQFRVTLYGNGDADRSGLVAIVAGLKKWVDDRSYYEKLLVGLLIAETLGLLFLAARVFFGV